jgi:uncharacterized tellurite resistance protein B-like protein
MNIAFLPEKIKSELGAFSEKIPVLAARSYGSIEGETGEGYLVSRAGKLLVFSRKAGEDNFRKLSGMFGKEISKLDIRLDKYNTFLDMNLNGIPYSVKFSGSEQKELENLVDSIKSYKPGTEQPDASDAAKKTSPPPAKTTIPDTVKRTPSTLTPLETLAVALMYVSSSDSKISEEEDRYIVEVFKENKPVLGTALAYYRAHRYEEFLRNIGSLNENQKLCVLANMVEIAMRDSSLHRTEQEYLRKFVEASGLKDEQYKAIRSVLYVKNWTGVLDE